MSSTPIQEEDLESSTGTKRKISNDGDGPHEKMAKKEGTTTELKLEIRALQAELREQKLLNERNALQTKVSKMEQEQKQQREKESAFTEQLKQLQTEQKRTTDEMAKLSKHQQQNIIIPFQNLWDANFCHDFLEISGPNRSIVRRKETNRFACSVLAKYDIRSTNSPIFYYEVRVEKMKRLAAIGLATGEMALGRMVGSSPHSYSYPGDGRFMMDGFSNEQKPTYTVGSVVGCGVNLATRQIIFTLNGQRLDTSELTVSSPLESLSPCISLWHNEDQIQANYGPNFLYNFGTL